MIKKTILYLLCLILPVFCFSQRGKKSNRTSIFISTSLNYYPTVTPYTFFSSYGGTTNDDVILNFITRNGGTFTVEEGESIIITRELTTELPTQILGIGFSVQFLKENFSFHELSLTKLSFAKSSHHTELIFYNTMEEVLNRTHLGYKQHVTTFAFRYEFGKYFGKRKKSKFKFGLSGGIEPSFYFYKRTSLSQQGYPIKANIQTIDLSVIPILSGKISKKLTLDFKVISNFLIGDFGSVVEHNPVASLDEQNGEREYNLPEISVAFSLLLRYNLTDSKKRR